MLDAKKPSGLPLSSTFPFSPPKKINDWFDSNFNRTKTAKNRSCEKSLFRITSKRKTTSIVTSLVSSLRKAQQILQKPRQYPFQSEYERSHSQWRLLASCYQEPPCYGTRGTRSTNNTYAATGILSGLVALCVHTQQILTKLKNGKIQRLFEI